MPAQPATIIHLKCASDQPSYDQFVHIVVVERETETAWFGRPVNNPAASTLEWPKFAWKAVPDIVAKAGASSASKGGDP